jgi:hypothetical protein
MKMSEDVGVTLRRNTMRVAAMPGSPVAHRTDLVGHPVHRHPEVAIVGSWK